MKFQKKAIKYEISKGSNLFESEPNIDINLSTFTALLHANNLVANLTW